MLFESLPDRVSVYEVSPRDGLQNESRVVSTADKVRLVDALVDAGLTRVEVTSFVSPKWVPQLADAEALLGALSPHRARYSALCPNPRGLARAAATGLREIVVFVSASEEHNRRNLNDTIDGTLARLREVVQEARAQGVSVRGCISTLWGFRSEQDVDLERAAAIGRALREMGCAELSLGDTMGIATPRRTRDILRYFLAEHPASSLSLHMHDTRGTALANVVVGLELGLRSFDAAVGGLGGCPFAPRATGNIVFEDLAFLCETKGFSTGIDIDKLFAVREILASEMPGEPTYGALVKAGLPLGFGGQPLAA